MASETWPEASILPIIVDGVDDDAPVRSVGTGFLLGRGLFVTCWHCVADPLPEGQRYVAAALDPVTGMRHVVPLFQLGRDHNGADLAFALTANWIGDDPPLRLSREQAYQGTQTWTLGFPLTEYVRSESGEVLTRITRRLLKGYITSARISDDPGREGMRLYELDMQAPRGLSGAPLMRDNYTSGTRDVLGVVQGVHEVHQLEDLASVDSATGARQVERVRIVTFALAVDTVALNAAKSDATQGMSVAEFLAKNDPEALTPRTARPTSYDPL